MASAGDLPADGPMDYREAVAQWRLELRTEVKRSSSLPSSMFDACDPMLETHLAGKAEAMLSALHAPPDPNELQATHPQTDPALELQDRGELVSAAELRSLPARIQLASPPIASLDAGLDEEYLAVLAELCATSNSATLARASELLLAALSQPRPEASA